MIHLMGVDHALAQRKKRGLPLTSLQRHYQSLVESAIQSIHPDLLAEEDHPDYLAEDGAESILHSIAHSNEIDHLFVEADRATQKSLGYKTVDILENLIIENQLAGGTPSRQFALAHKIAHQFPIRERNWLRILGNTAATNILLVFGDLHFTTLTGLLAAEGIQFDIFAERVGVDPANDPEYVAFRYAIENNLFGMSDCFCLKN